MKTPKNFKVVPLESGGRYTRLLKNGVDSLCLKSGYVVLNPRESVGEHSTENKEEIVIFLEGRAEIIIEGKKSAVIKDRCALYVPPKTSHNIKNIGKGPLKYVFTVTPVK